MPVHPARRLEGLAAWRSPAHPAPVDLDLRGNEGGEPDPALLRAVTGADVLRRYPDASALEARLAARLGVDPSWVIATAGGDDALDRACRVAAEPSRRVLLPAPGFEMTARYARLAGGEVVTLEWPGGRFPTEELLAALTPGVGLVALTSPNNPTGAVLQPYDLERVALAADAVGALTLLDLAYTEFADVDLTPLALSLPGTVVARTLSKAWGLAGLRVGYAVAGPPVGQWLRAVGTPYPVSAPSLAVAEAALDAGDGAMQVFVAHVRATRGALERALADGGCEVVPSQANFVFARTPRHAWLVDGLAGLGVGVRSFPDEAHLEQAVRMGCPPDAAGTARAVAALRATLQPQGLLVDAEAVAGGFLGSHALAEALASVVPCAVVGLGGLSQVTSSLAGAGFVHGFPVRTAGPEAVPAALAALGVGRAWMVAASPAAVLAARRGGVVPLGWDPAGGGAALLAAGAGRVVSRVAEVLELLP